MFSQHEMSEDQTAKVCMIMHGSKYRGRIGKGWLGLITLPRRLSEAGIFHFMFYFISSLLVHVTHAQQIC